uniref:Uncharacterized protein n=1 Tax=Daphnia galeata TaxID=27404 RepID=A0A8J2RYA8_9CRUS|nr:unnamed protein product [Daphnia galeata]
MNFPLVTLALMMFTILLVNAQTTNTPITKPQVVVVPTVLVPTGNPGGAGCFWSGTSPFCFGKCGRFYNTVAVDNKGDGKQCLSGMKKLCCPQTNLLVG